MGRFYPREVGPDALRGTLAVRAFLSSAGFQPQRIRSDSIFQHYPSSNFRTRDHRTRLCQAVHLQEESQVLDGLGRPVSAESLSPAFLYQVLSNLSSTILVSHFFILSTRALLLDYQNRKAGIGSIDNPRLDLGMGERLHVVMIGAGQSTGWLPPQTIRTMLTSRCF